MLVAANIPDAYLVAALPVLLVSLIGIMTWMVREMAKIQIINAAMSERINQQAQELTEQRRINTAYEVRLRVLERTG